MKYKLVIFLLMLVTYFLYYPALHAQIRQNKPAVITVDSGLVDYKYSTKQLSIYGNIKKYMPEKTVTAKLLNHQFVFDAEDINSFCYADISLVVPLLNSIQTLGFIVEPADLVHISYKNGAYQFSGKDGKKYECYYKLQFFQHKEPEFPRKDKAKILNYYKEVDQFISDKLALLAQYKNHISPNVYSAIRAQIICENNASRVGNIGSIDSEAEMYLPYLKEYKNPYLNKEFFDGIKHQGYFKQHFVGELILSQFLMDSCYAKGERFNLWKCYGYFKEQFKGSQLRDWSLTWFINREKDKAQSREVLLICIDDALKTVLSNSYKASLTAIQSFSPGAVAYNFTLKDQNGNVRKLSDFRGKVVLIDFWKIPCGACIDLHHQLDSMGINKAFAGKDFVFLSICAYENREGWLKEMATKRYTFPENVNLMAEGGYYDPAIIKYGIVSYPTLMLIDKQGKIIDKPFDIKAMFGQISHELSR